MMMVLFQNKIIYMPGTTLIHQHALTPTNSSTSCVVQAFLLVLEKKQSRSILASVKGSHGVRLRYRLETGKA